MRRVFIEGIVISLLHFLSFNRLLLRRNRKISEGNSSSSAFSAEAIDEKPVSENKKIKEINYWKLSKV